MKILVDAEKCDFCYLVEKNVQNEALASKTANAITVATRDIQPDEVLFKLARSSKVILGPDSEAKAQYPNAFESLDNDPWLSMIVTMMYEYSLGSQSHWKPYFDVLPETFDTLIFWTKTELSELQASAVVDKIGKASAEENFTNTLLPVIKQLPSLAALDDAQLLTLYHRMGSTIMAYAFDVEPSPSTLEADDEGFVSDTDEDQLPKCMVPLADMLNADASRNNARLFYEEDCLEMRSTQPVKAGEELFNDYGELPRSELLRRYGYITDQYKPYDVVEINQEFMEHHIKFHTGLEKEDMEERLAYLEDRGDLDGAYDLNRPDPDAEPGTTERLLSIANKDIILCVRICQIERAAFEDLQSRRSKPKLLPTPNTAEFQELTVLNSSIAQDLLKSYPTKLEEDLQLRETAGKLSHRQVMALEIRIGEKEILQEFIKTCQALEGGTQVENGGDVSGKTEMDDQDEHASKRRKVG